MLKREDLVGDKRDAVVYVSGATAPRVSILELDNVRLDRAIETKILLPGPKASFLEHHLENGQSIPPHRYAHDVVHYLVRGKMQVTLAGESYQAEARDAWSAAPGVEISLEALEESVLVEWMSPPHLVVGNRLITWGSPTPCTSHIFTRWVEQQEMRIERVEGGTEFGPHGKDIRQFMKVLVPGPNVGLIWLTHLKSKFANHIHRHHFLCYLLRGKMREKFGGTQEHICYPGDIWTTQGGSAHYTEALADNDLLEYKWPAPMIWRGIIHSWERR